MAPRAIGTSVVTFGLVNIPIKLFSSGQPGKGVHFNLLHRDCGSRLKQQYLCVREGVEVPRSDMVKGYEAAKGQYVVFTDEEIKALEEERSAAIEIVEFVPLDQVDPVYFDGAYYMGPDKGAERAYHLLREAMNKTGQAALARHTARGRSVLVLIRPHEDAIVMQQLRFHDEVRSPSELSIPTAKLKDSELELAERFIEQLQSDEPHLERFEDTYRKRFEEVVEQKLEGKEVTISAEDEAPQAEVIDLLEALKASLASDGKGPRARSEAKASETGAKGGESKRGGSKAGDSKGARPKPPKRAPARKGADEAASEDAAPRKRASGGKKRAKGA